MDAPCSTEPTSVGTSESMVLGASLVAMLRVLREAMCREQQCNESAGLAVDVGDACF
jgi:hypothetical protein